MQRPSMRKVDSSQPVQDKSKAIASAKFSSTKMVKESSRLTKREDNPSPKQSISKKTQRNLNVIRYTESQFGVSEEVPSEVDRSQLSSRIEKASPTKPKAVKPLTLEQKITESALRVNNQEYQQMLIREKQLELDLLQQQAIKKQLKVRIHKEKKVIHEAHDNIQTARYDLQKKQDYLKDYYRYLDGKLQGNSGVPKSLFAKLGKLEKMLLEKYQSESRDLVEDMDELRFTQRELRKKVEELNQKKLKVGKKFTEENSDMKSAEEIHSQQGKIIKKRQLQKKYQELKRYYYEIQKQTQTKKGLQSEEKILKKLLNIEEQHKKHSLIIENGIKKEFKIKLRNNRYKMTVGMEYSFKLPELINLISTRVDKKLQMKDNIKKKNAELEELKMRFNFLIIQYSTLESEILSKKS